MPCAIELWVPNAVVGIAISPGKGLVLPGVSPFSAACLFLSLTDVPGLVLLDVMVNLGLG